MSIELLQVKLNLVSAQIANCDLIGENAQLKRALLLGQGAALATELKAAQEEAAKAASPLPEVDVTVTPEGELQTVKG